VRTALVAAAALAAAAPLAAQQQGAQPRQQERIHVVQQGETLWDIARAYLSDPFLWPEIFRLNTDVVEDPARIYPSERLRLPDGITAVQQSGDGRTIFYRGAQADRDIRGTERMPYPAVAEGDFYRVAFVARDDEVRPVGRLAELEYATGAALDRPPAIQLYDRVFVALQPGSEVQVGDRLHFVRGDREVARAGRMWRSTGIGTVAARDGDVATVVMVRLYHNAEPGDLALPLARFPLEPGIHPRPAADLQARILGFENEHPILGPEEIAFLDVGRQAGVKEGDEFEVYIPRTQRDWGTRPELRVARLQVVKVTEGTASARITGVEQPTMEVGYPVRRVARMP
jgi:hypothetical protein